jgi:hypothetical protein
MNLKYSNIVVICIFQMMLDLWCRSTVADTKNGPFFVSHKGYRIRWLAPKIGYQPTLQTFFCSSVRTTTVMGNDDANTFGNLEHNDFQGEQAQVCR